jgi:hypothetical protein
MSDLSDLRVEPARRVRLAMPAYGAVEDDTHPSVVEGCKALKAAGIEVQFFDAVPGCCYVDYARNLLVERFLRSDATDLVFIDSDVGFEPDALVRLCQSTRPIVAGIYPKKIDPPQWPVRVPAGEIWSDADGLVVCDFVPTGFMRIHRSVFRRMTVPRYKIGAVDLAPRPVTVVIEGSAEVGAFFQCVVENGEYVGEDVEFCRRWQRAGGVVRAFADMELRHSGGGQTWRGNWGQWLLSQKQRAAA